VLPPPLPAMAVGPHLELAPLTDALPDSLAGDSYGATDTLTASSSPVHDAVCKEDLEHDLPAVSASTWQQLRYEAVRWACSYECAHC
jgi:hypothetical protein